MVVYQSSPPPLMCFFPIGTPLSENKKLLADGGVPIEEKHVKGGGLLYGGLLPERNFQVEYLQIFFYLQIPYLQITFYLQIGICKYLFICR